MNLEGLRINMTEDIKIKLCGLRRECDIKWANSIRPDMIGFVFYSKSKRFISFKDAKVLKNMLLSDIKAVGVFVNESPEKEAELINNGTIDYVQLHGLEDEEHIRSLRGLCDCRIIQAFKIEKAEDIDRARKSSADMVLLDCGDGGSGHSFDWSLAKDIDRDFILAGGLDVNNITTALTGLKPWGVDVSSGIESEGYKDKSKMVDFAKAVRNFSCKG